jgi:hypothetical protein
VLKGHYYSQLAVCTEINLGFQGTATKRSLELDQWGNQAVTRPGTHDENHPYYMAYIGKRVGAILMLIHHQTGEIPNE